MTGALLATRSEEYQDLIAAQRHQTLQQDSSNGCSHKGHFQLINMSFSQENNSSERVTESHENQPEPIPQRKPGQKTKNPHNTLNESFQKDMPMSYQEYEEMVEGHYSEEK